MEKTIHDIIVFTAHWRSIVFRGHMRFRLVSSETLWLNQQHFQLLCNNYGQYILGDTWDKMEGSNAQNGGVWSIIHPVGSILVNIWSVFPLIKIFIWQNSGLTARVYRPIREFSSHHKYLIYILYISIKNLTNNRFTGLKKSRTNP